MVFTAEQDPGGFVSVMVKSGVLEMSRVMKGLLLAVFFFTVFLIVFLLFNLRPDPVEVLSQRIKRFQIQLLEQLMGSQGGSDWERWKKELEARRGEITHQIMRGIGKVSPKQKPEVDAYVSKSWDEIIDLLGRRAEVTTSAAASPIDISRLENLIRQALKNAQFVAPLQKPISPSEEGLAAAQRSGAGQAALMEAEEPAEEVLEELEEARSTEAVPELEAVGEPAEAVEELEEIGEHEEAVPMGPELLAAPGVEEAEELEAVPDADEVEEAGEPVEVEEVSEIEEASGAEEPVEVEEISEVEEASEAEEPVEVEEALEVEEATEVEEALEVQEDAAAGLESGAEELDAMQPEELEEIEEPEPAAVATGVTSGRVSELIEVTVPSGTAELEDAELPAEDSAAFRTSEEYLEELEPIAEIIPLPPEPVEEGLELLPVADEKPAGMESPLEDWRLMIDSDKDRMREAYSYSESGGARPSGDVGEEARGAEQTRRKSPYRSCKGSP
jgi:hypothetical protein